MIPCASELPEPTERPERQRQLLQIAHAAFAAELPEPSPRGTYYLGGPL